MTSVIVMESRLRDAAKEGEGMNMAVRCPTSDCAAICREGARPLRPQQDRPGQCRPRSGADPAQKKMSLLLKPADHHQRFAEVSLGMPRSVGQRHKHLSTAALMFADIVLNRRIAFLKFVLVPQPFKNTLGGVAWLAAATEVLLQPLINQNGECIKLGLLDLSRAQIAPSRVCEHAREGNGAAPKTP